VLNEVERDVQIYYQSGTIMVEDKYEEEQWYLSKEFVNSEMLEGWYFEGHYTITDKPKDPLAEYPEGHTVALIFFFTDAKGLAEIYPDGDALLTEIDDTTRFEINTSKFDLTVTKGEISEELRIFIQEELDRAKKEYGIS
tara:strand:+ start:60 stop:479 length:420 start_codon:yes stop_codon:yes gene_type:complete